MKRYIVCVLLVMASSLYANENEFNKVRLCNYEVATLHGFVGFLNSAGYELPKGLPESVDEVNREFSQAMANLRLEILAEDIYGKNVSELNLKETETVTRMYKLEVDKDISKWEKQYKTKLNKITQELSGSGKLHSFNTAISNYNACRESTKI